MSYVVFKLNIQPDILLKYKKSNEIDYLLFDRVPLAFENVMQVEEKSGLFKLISQASDEQTFNTLFTDLESKTVRLFENYQQILSRYKKNNDIHYSKDFLSLNEECMSERRSLERKYPGISKAYELITDEEIDKYSKIESESKVGTGITHLRKFFKIKLYLEKYKDANVLNPLGLEAYYNPKTEHILVNSESETIAQNYIIALVNLVNENFHFTQHIGKININPIYESISFEGEYNEISFVIVYPNGNPPLDRYNILRDSEAKEIHTKIVGSDGKPLINEPIEILLREEAQKGYLKSVKPKGSGIFRKIKKVMWIDENS